MPDENRIPLFVRVLPDLKSDLEEAAWRERVSVSRFVERLLEDRLRPERQSVGAE